jgi:2-methylcitrate dehydratase PrpD
MNTPLNGTAAEQIAAWALSWRRSLLPVEVDRQMKLLLLNGLGASVAAIGHPWVRLLDDWAPTVAPGQPSASIMWRSRSTTIGEAALVNAAMMEILDYNETHLEAFVHPTAPVWPAVQAVAQEHGALLSESLKAAAIGIEAELLVATMLMPGHYERGFNPAVAAGAVGAAVGSGVVAGLDQERMTSAIGLAALGGGGPLEALGSIAHPLSIGRAARMGVEAVGHAACGLIGPGGAIEAPFGLLNTMSDPAPGLVESAFKGLGREWRILGPIAFKLFPTETITHASVQAILDLRSQTPVSSRPPLESLVLFVSPLVERVVTDRLASRDVPTNDLEARFDLTYCVAAAWVRGRLSLAEFAQDAIADAEILNVRGRISLVSDDELPMTAAKARAVYGDGTSEEIRVAAFTGSPDMPLGVGQLVEKLSVNIEGPKANVGQLVDLVLGDVPDVPLAEFLALLDGLGTTA